MERKTIAGLDAEEYEHPLDRQALKVLQSYATLELAVRKLNEYGIERVLRVQYTGSNVRVTDRNFPEVMDALREVCDTLCVSPIPSLYMRWAYDVNAFTMGVQSPIVVLHSGCIDLLSAEELLFVLGHEVGHIKSQHVLYHQMASVIPILGEILGAATLGLGGLISTGLQIPLLNWVRMSEFTADRAGLLACQDPRIATSALMKTAGVPSKYFDRIDVEGFIAQAREFEDLSPDAFDKIARAVSIMWQGHPWTVLRASQFFRWIDSGEYDRLLRRGVSKSHVQAGSNETASGSVLDPSAGSQSSEFTRSRESMFCALCGAPLRLSDARCARCGCLRIGNKRRA